jgi:hypothetical protein
LRTLPLPYSSTTARAEDNKVSTFFRESIAILPLAAKRLTLGRPNRNGDAGLAGQKRGRPRVLHRNRLRRGQDGFCPGQ